MNKKRKIKKQKIYLSIVAILLGWLSLTNMFVLIKYDVLPLKYLFIVMLLLIVLPILIITFMLKKKTKPKIKITLSVISIILIIPLCFMLFFLNKTFKFLDNLGESKYKTENYLVMVLKDSNYNDINDLNNKNMGYVNNETSKIDEAITELDKIISAEKIEQENYDELVNKLYDNELESIMIEESYKSIINDNITDFEEKTKTIYTIEIQIEKEDVVKNVDVKSDAFNIYISGIDTYGNISSVSRSDVNIIATVNPTTNQILLTTIPRDYYVQLDGTDGYKDKLTHAGIYGIDKSIKTIENLLDIDINYYFKVNFSSVEKLVDTLGGVDVYSEYTFTGTGGSSFTKGYNRVNGKQALEFARTRYTVVGGDRTRGKNQQALISAMINKACSKEIITRYSSILKTLEGSFETNMSADKITDLIKKQIDDMKSWNVTSISLDGSDGHEYTYSYSHQLLYVMIPYEETINNAKEKIRQVQNNETLEGSYIENNGSVNTPTHVIEEPKKEEPKKEEPKKEEPKPVEEQKPQEVKPTEEVKEEKPAEEKTPENTTDIKQEEPKKEETEPVEEINHQETKPTEEQKVDENKAEEVKEETKTEGSSEKE